MADDQRSALARRLTALRGIRGMNQVEIAAALDVTPLQWNHWESGRRELPLRIALKLFDRGWASLDWIYRDVGRLPAPRATKR